MSEFYVDVFPRPMVLTLPGVYYKVPEGLMVSSQSEMSKYMNTCPGEHPKQLPLRKCRGY